MISWTYIILTLSGMLFIICFALAWMGYMRVRLTFAWYDVWIGAYWDRRHRRLYILPLPMLGVCFYFRDPHDLGY